MATPTAAPLLWINGFPGAGKLTVAREISALDGTAIIIDNHQLIDPVAAQFARSHPDYTLERRRLRQTFLEKYVCDIASISRLVVFTDFQSDNDLGKAVAREYMDAAFKSGRPFVPIYLTCDLNTNIGRIASVDRLESGTTKLTDAKVLQNLRLQCKLFHFEDSECPGLTVDSSYVNPSKVATRILAFAEDARQHHASK